LRTSPEDEQFLRSLVGGRKQPIQLFRASKKDREYALRIDAIN